MLHVERKELAMPDCSQCGDPNCADVRAAARREPWLHGGFELGVQWYSFDGGLSWTRCPTWEQVRAWQERRIGDMRSMTVVAIDRNRGEVTIKVAP